MTIQSFKNEDARKLFEGTRIARWANIARPAVNKLAMLNAAHALDDLRIPPGNRLEALKAGRKGQYSIRINDQWRVCFAWTRLGPKDVEIVDYH